MSTSKQKLLDLLFRRHEKELLVFAGKRSKQEEAEDLVQDAYVRLLQHPSPDSIENLRAFLYQTTSNLTVDRHRHQVMKARFQLEPETDEHWDELLASAESSQPTPETHFGHLQELEQFAEMLQELPKKTRHAFMLRRIEGLSHAEVAARLGISVRSSEHHVHLALRHLLKHRSFD